MRDNFQKKTKLMFERSLAVNQGRGGEFQAGAQIVRSLLMERVWHL